MSGELTQAGAVRLGSLCSWFLTIVHGWIIADKLLGTWSAMVSHYHRHDVYNFDGNKNTKIHLCGEELNSI